MKSNKKYLRIQPIVNIVFSILVAFVVCIIMALPYLLHWEIELIPIIFFYLIFAFAELYFLFIFLSNMQFVKIEGDYLIVKKYIFINIAKIKIEDIYDITIEELSGHSNSASPVLRWITIFQTKQQMECSKRKLGGKNKRGCFPVQIVASKKNLEVISDWIRVYSKKQFDLFNNLI